jgi:hypothetical protein
LLAAADSSINDISYVRFRSAALRNDPNGLFVEYVKVEIHKEIQETRIKDATLA